MNAGYVLSERAEGPEPRFALHRPLMLTLGVGDIRCNVPPKGGVSPGLLSFFASQRLSGKQQRGAWLGWAAQVSALPPTALRPHLPPARGRSWMACRGR